VIDDGNSVNGIEREDIAAYGAHQRLACLVVITAVRYAAVFCFSEGILGFNNLRLGLPFPDQVEGDNPSFVHFGPVFSHPAIWKGLTVDGYKIPGAKDVRATCSASSDAQAQGNC